MFYGSLRVHEVFPKKKSEYGPDRTLLSKNKSLHSVHINGYPVEVLMINIKGPKEALGNSVKVELFANGTKSFPVRAYKKLLYFWGHSTDWFVPLMTKSGWHLSKRQRIQQVVGSSV